jgi:hypothetical protein
MSNYKFPLGEAIAEASDDLEPLKFLGFGLPTSKRVNSRWILATLLLAVGFFAGAIGSAASLANPPAGGHGDAEGGLIAAVVITSCFALVFLFLVYIFWSHSYETPDKFWWDRNRRGEAVRTRKDAKQGY